MYKNAKLGKIQNFTGIDSPFEYPKKTETDLIIETNLKSPNMCVKDILDFFKEKQIYS